MCYNPYIRVILPGIETKNGKPGGRLYKYDSILEKELIQCGWPYQLIPCGKCLECRTEYATSWSHRLWYEARVSQPVYFITLTYTDAPFSLKKGDLVSFLKRLREYARRNLGVDNMRYFACGEYGSMNHRPHYHLILFNVPLELSQLFPDHSFHRGSFDLLFYSKVLDNLWNKGFITVAEANYQTFGYVARYSMKKINDTDDLIKKYDLQKPFLLMSKGLGKDYFLKNIDDHIKTDSVYSLNGEKVKISKLPRYFDKILEKYKPIEYEEIKKNRDFYVTASVLNKNCRNALDIISELRDRKVSKIAKCERLKRVI